MKTKTRKRTKTLCFNPMVWDCLFALLHKTGGVKEEADGVWNVTETGWVFIEKSFSTFRLNRTRLLSLVEENLPAAIEKHKTFSANWEKAQANIAFYMHAAANSIQMIGLYEKIKKGEPLSQ